MTLAQLREAVRHRLAEAVENYWKDSQITRALNDAQKRFCHEEEWSWLYTIQEGIPVASGNPHVELIDDVSVGRHFNLILTKPGETALILPKRIDPSRGIRVRQLETATGEPRWYYVAKNVINTYEDDDRAIASVVRLIPTPSVAYEAEYHFVREPTPMVAEDDEPDIPDAYHDALVAWATMDMWSRERGMERKVVEQAQLYQAVLEQAMAEHRKPAQDEVLAWGNEEPEPWAMEWPSLRNFPEELG